MDLVHFCSVQLTGLRHWTGIGLQGLDQWSLRWRIWFASMLRHLPPTPPLNSFLAHLITFPLLVACNQPLYPSSSPSSELGWPQHVVKEDQAEWPQNQQEDHHGQRFLRPNSRVQQEETSLAEAMHSMQTVMRQILSNQENVLANQEWLIRNQQYLMKRAKYLSSQQKLVTPYVRKGLQELQKPDNDGLHLENGKILEKLRREAFLEKEKIRWEANLEKEKLRTENLELGLPDHLQPSRIVISNFR